jgi:hypothetical protein
VGKQASQDHPNLQLLPYSVGKFRFRFDSYITTHGCDSHSLIIKDFTVDEVKHYTINIKEGKSSKPKVLFSRPVMLRHFGKMFGWLNENRDLLALVRGGAGGGAICHDKAKKILETK